MSVTTIPLAPVVAFLRKHGTLNVLEGAPVTGPVRDPLFLSALSRASLTEMAGPCDLRGSHLYLGTSEVCPAAEGWASRVLAMARHAPSDHVGRMRFVVGVDVIWLDWPNSMVFASWRWNRDYESDGVECVMDGAMPPTPAERLRAVLLYELERSR